MQYQNVHSQMPKEYEKISRWRCDSTHYLVAQLALDPGSGIIGVAVKVVQVVGHNKRTRTILCADRVGLVAVVAEDIGPLVHGCEGCSHARVVGGDVGTVQDIVGLVCNVSGVTEESNGGDWNSCQYCINDKFEVSNLLMLPGAEL